LEYTLNDERRKTPSLPSSPSALKNTPPQAFYTMNRSFMKPSKGYIAPASSFFFGPPTHHSSLIDFLPSRFAADRLVKQYFLSVHPIAKILHRPSFEKEYDAFWDDVAVGVEPPSSAQATVFAVMFSGVVSMEEEMILREFGVSKENLINNFRLGTETALGRGTLLLSSRLDGPNDTDTTNNNAANFLRTTKVETLQAFVMYLVSSQESSYLLACIVLTKAADTSMSRRSI
jgi:hypothetical protein